jgi:hypothetical protein
MKVKHILIFILFVAILSPFLYPSNSLAKWAYKFVVYDDYTYVVKDEFVTEIDKEIGHVTKYSGIEGTYYGNFSNVYKEGTKYYSIKGVSTETAIAVEVNGNYIKAIRKGEYAGWKYSPFSLILGGLIIFILLTLLIYLVQRKVNSRKFY